MIENALENCKKLSSGSTLINLACSGSPQWAATSGRYFWMVGDSSSGKTFITLGFLAEASINKEFDDYDLIFDNAEDGALMDVEKYFGPRLAERLRPPAYDADKEPLYSSTIEEFYFSLDDRLQLVKKGKAKKFIWLLDSMDALSSKYEGEKFDKKKAASKPGAEKAKGDYGDGKAKVTSSWIRRVVADLRDTDCTLIVLSQTRDNIGGGLFDPKSVHAGGRALKFYATWNLWTSLGAKLKRSVRGKERQIGITSRISVKKNRLTGKEWTVEVPIYWATGIDDVGSCVDFLISEKHWKREGKDKDEKDDKADKDDKSSKIIAKEFDFVGLRGILIDKIESEDLEFDLRDIVRDVWKSIEAACAVHRKNKYHVG